MIINDRTGSAHLITIIGSRISLAKWSGHNEQHHVTASGTGVTYQSTLQTPISFLIGFIIYLSNVETALLTQRLTMGGVQLKYYL